MPLPNGRLTWLITNTSIVVYRIDGRAYAPGHGRKLAEDLGCECVSKSQPPAHGNINERRLIFNYGRASWPKWFRKDRHTWLNQPKFRANAADKIKCFNVLGDEGVPVIPMTTDKDEALAWMEAGHSIYARATAHGKKGQGITVVRAGEALPESVFYTRARPERDEYRVNVFGGKIIDCTMKKRIGAAKMKARGIDQVNMEIRNLKGGWIYARQDINPSAQTKMIALLAIKACGLNHGGVDVFQYPNGDAEICEVNTAPGMRGTTRKNYQAAIEERLAQENL